MNISKDLVAASATPLILSILKNGESYGYEIIKQIHTLSGGKVEWTDGMLYPVLHRLEKRDFIKSRWVVCENGRKRKYYSMNESGTKELAIQRNQWNLINSMIEKIQEGGLCFN